VLVDTAPFSRIEAAEHVDAAFDAPGPALDHFDAECIRESLDREARIDGVPVQVQFSVQLDECHPTLVAGEDGERRRTQVLALERVRVRAHWRNGFRATAVRHAEPVHDVLRVDPRPHADAQLGELRPHLCQLAGELLLRGIELGRALK
jgi:hypothetical protein